MAFIQVDASAGGQVFRTAIGLSAITKQPVHVFNIRKERPKGGGLERQHLLGLQSLSNICQAKTRGAEFKSLEVWFEPKASVSGKWVVQTNSAASISLLFQSILPIALTQSIQLRAFGGTDVPYAPSVRFLEKSLLPQLKSMGARIDCKLHSFGFYPKGSGSASLESKPAKFPLKPIELLGLGNLERIELYSHAGGLPTEVAINQLNAAKKILLKEFPETELLEFNDSVPNSQTVGNAIDGFAFYSSGAVLSANALGVKGKPAFEAGKESAKKLVDCIRAGQPVDSHLIDQLIPFMALAKGESEIHCAQFSEHAKHNIAVTEQFLPIKFDVQGELGKPCVIRVNGIGFSSSQQKQ